MSRRPAAAEDEADCSTTPQAAHAARPSVTTARSKTVLEPAGPGSAAFAACQRLFRDYPLAVRRHYAEHRYGSMVLLHQDGGTARFLVLIMEWDDLFVLRHWDRRDGSRVEVSADGPATGDGGADVARLIEASVPVPRDGALLGWLSGQQVSAVVAAYGRLPEPWDDPSAVPGVLVLPRAGSQPAEWPPLATSPRPDWQLWECVERGRLVDLTPLVSRSAGRVFWVPGEGGWQAGARVVVTERISDGGLWLPAGVYADHWSLREGIQVRTASQILALPGVVDLSGGRGPDHLLGV
jgi:hypothetical protein